MFKTEDKNQIAFTPKKVFYEIITHSIFNIILEYTECLLKSL